MDRIHPTAVVHPDAQLHDSVTVGPFAVIGPKVRVGAGTTIGAHAVIDGRTTLGERNRLFQFAALGAAPQDLKYRGEDTELVLGDDNIVREFATLHIGTEGGGGLTRVGSKSVFMANSHVAHDCQVGNGVILGNGSALAGHVEVHDGVIISGLAAVHQFTRLGRNSFISGGSMVVMDVPPYCTAQGDRAELAGINTVGLSRHGYTEAQLARIKDAYRILFRSKLGLAEALAQLKAEHGGNPEVDLLIDFVKSSKRGLTR